ncbi:hypothetical protein SERLA73DRAFT_134513 [Serpula lacrymans var. lacrymans S7.3]|uniref:F-box domain-containing protein n=2 Tax=Serpula lacrymans var. lacrymans TaxID=341189 RepID=F8PS38_SERL3|nr:hypothetical protein SERLA73DRAFT_134513 [Serpula lacrymans var. lacrymans S7.3]
MSNPPLKRRTRKRLDDGVDKLWKLSNVNKSRDSFSALNFDVIFHLCTFLHPMDLLNLARTSKPFRQLLMSKSSAFIWKFSRLQVEDMPQCPPDLNEPQYANLAFGLYCQNCGKVGQCLFWQFRARYCTSCVKIW